MPPLPKPPHLRQRTNRAATAATLPYQPPITRRPPLPERGRDWHPRTRAWWRSLWESPAAAKFLRSDVDELYILAELVDRFWEAPSTALAAEIRQQHRCFGLDPLSRQRLMPFGLA